MTTPWYDGHLDRGPDGGSAPIWHAGPAGPDMPRLYGPDDPAWEVDDAAYEKFAAQTRAELAAEADDPDAGPEPGTYEWHIATGNYIDPEPEWDHGEPYVDERHGVMFYDTVAGYEAGRDRYPSYRHVSPEPERDAEAGLWHRSP